MSDIKRLSVNNLYTEGYLTKVIPCIHIHDDGQSLTLTSLTIQKKEDTKDGDTFLTSEQFINLISQPADGTANLKDSDYISHYNCYDNLLIEYKHFPGFIKEIFEKFDAVLKIRMKITFKFIAAATKDYNWVGFMKYFNPPLFNVTSNMIMGSMKLFNFDEVNLKISEGVYHLLPSVVFKIPGNNQIPNLNECDIVILHPDPGYHCNLQLKELGYEDFKANNYSDIVIDTEVFHIIRTAELRYKKKLLIDQNTTSTILGSPAA